jgi:hypothetical protein
MYIYSYKNNYNYTGNKLLDKIINYYFNNDNKYFVSYKTSEKKFSNHIKPSSKIWQ